jgi:iron complex outermembrane recepter protein
MRMRLIKDRSVYRRIALSVACGTIVLAGTSKAGSEAGSDADLATGANDSALQEITVTAQRRSENLQKVPISITVLSSNDLAKQNIVGPEDLNSQVPSLSVGSSSVMRDSAIYQIRGLGQTPAGDPSVVTYFAEVPSDATGPGFLFDLQNIQVLKGPQGTLFGRSTTGGAVLLQPVKPGNDFGGYVDVSLGDYNMRRVQAAVDVPVVSDVFLVRVAIDSNRRDGYTTDVVTGTDYDRRDYTAERVSVLIRPFEGFENYTIIDHAQANNTESGSILEAFNPNGLVAQAFPDVAGEFAAQQARGIRETNLGPGPYFQNIRNLGFTNITTYDVNDAITLKNIAAYRLFSYRTISNIIGVPDPIIVEVAYPQNGAGGASDPSNIQVTEEAQVQGKALDNRLTYIGGVYYEHVKPESGFTADEIVQFGAPIVLESLKYGTNRSAYFQDTYELTDSLKLTTGARYSEDARSQEASDFIGSPLTECTFTPPQPVDCLAKAAAKFHATTWNVTLDEQITADTLLYLSAKRGYKSGGFNASSPFATGRIYYPEFVITGELGVKNQFEVLNMPGRVSFDVYRTWFKDLQENVTFTVGTASYEGVSNAGLGYIEGAEFEGSIKLAPWFTLSGFWGYTDPKYTENETALGNLTEQPFYNVPRNKVSATGEFEHQLANLGTGTLSATYTYQSMVYFDEPVIPTFTNPNRGQRGYGLLNMHAGLNNVRGTPLDFGVFVTNLTNKAYKIFEFDDYDSLGTASAIYGEPRMWGVNFRYRFGHDAE